MNTFFKIYIYKDDKEIVESRNGMILSTLCVVVWFCFWLPNKPYTKGDNIPYS